MFYWNSHVRMTFANALTKLSTQRRWYSFVGLCLFVAFPIFSQSPPIKNGVNIQASYYNRGNVTIGWGLMADYPEIEAVRIEIEPDRVSQAIQWIKEAQKAGYQVIATYHKSTQLGTNNLDHLQTATRWWLNNYAILASNGPIIINIMNEWGGHDLAPETYATAYNEAIEQLRTIYSGTFIVDLPGFGNNTKIVAEAYDLFVDQNIIFSAHIYSGSFNVGANRWLNISDLEVLAATGVNCMVGEFCNGNNGGADWCRMIDYAIAQDWPIFGWAWNGDGRGMNMVSPSWQDQPRATSFEPTLFLERIIAKLAGNQCFTQVFESENAEPCTASNIGAACDDNNDFTINDQYNEYCVCTGVFVENFNTAPLESSIFLFPNPTFRTLNVELIKLRRIEAVSIFNHLGQLMKTLPITNPNLTVTLDISDLTNGTYFVVAVSNDRLIAERFLKMD